MSKFQSTVQSIPFSGIATTSACCENVAPESVEAAPYMLALPDVTLCCVDTKNHALALRSLQRSMRDVEFARVIFLTDASIDAFELPADIEIHLIDPICSHDAYSQRMLKGLSPYVETDFVLVTQWDGYVTNAAAWTPTFLDCDYVGALWPSAPVGKRVGNGGFSLRSRKLLNALLDERVQLAENEDSTICTAFRPLLESEYAIKFGSEALAQHFSFEMDYSSISAGVRTLGFHGLFNMCFVEPQADLILFAKHLSAEIATSEFCMFLLRNCVIRKQWAAAAALGGRMYDVDPRNEETARIVAQTKRHLADRK